MSRGADSSTREGETARANPLPAGFDAARRMAEAVAARRASPVEVVEAAVERAWRCQGRFNAFSRIFDDEAVEEARSLERNLAAGGPAGPLAGVPVAVKDMFDVRGRETTGCCRAYAGRVAGRDAEVVRRLRAAGAILVGKTNQHELGCGTTGLVSACGPVANPRGPDRLAGGSSGGSAAALAAGAVALALGSDTGGSIRVPASFCGVVGLKPTTGRLPTDGAMPLAPSMDCPGPMARSADDLALAWESLRSPLSSPPSAGAPTPGPLSVGILDGLLSGRLDPAIESAVTATAVGLLELGVDVWPAGGADLEDAPEVWADLAWPELAESHRELRDRVDMLDPRTRALVERGASTSPGRRGAAARRAGEIRARLEGLLRRADALLLPATPYPAPPADRRWVEVRPGVRLDVHLGGPGLVAKVANLAGLPALVLPAAASHEGLPLGVQLIGRRWQDEALLSLARRLEPVLPGAPGQTTA